MSLYAPRPWLVAAAVIGTLAAALALTLAMSGTGPALAGLLATAVFAVPFALGEWLFAHIESLGRATGRTRVYAAGGGFVAETTTTAVGLWLAGAANLTLTAAGVLAIALANGAIHVSF